MLRKSQFTVVTKAANKIAWVVTEAIWDYIKPYWDRLLTSTYGLRQRELSSREEIERDLTTQGLIQHAYHSWELGLNEKTNCLIRQYVRKGKAIDDLCDEDVAEIIEKINMKPKKYVGFSTPIQLFLQYLWFVALIS